MRPRHHTKTKHRILEAALQQFAHYGFSKVTMDEIAGDVGLGKASLYYYYRTKEQLFQAVMVHEHQEFMKGAENMLTQNVSCAEKIHMYVMQRFEYFNKLLHLNILDFRSSVKTTPGLRETFDGFALQELKLLHKIVREGKQRGEFKVTSVEKVSEALLHIMQGLRCRFLRAVQGPKIDPKQHQQFKQELNFVTEIFLRGIQT